MKSKGATSGAVGIRLATWLAQSHGEASRKLYGFYMIFSGFYMSFNGFILISNGFDMGVVISPSIGSQPAQNIF